MILNACETANGGANCASRACAVELGFLRDWWTLQQQFYVGTLDNEVGKYKHISAGGTFDPESSCMKIPGDVSEKRCCGNYPLRFPYRTLDGSRSCCGDTTFNNQVHECCAGNTISISC